MSGKFALIIGNTEYTDPGLAQLTAPGKDAEDFARVLKDQEIGAFDSVNVLVNEQASSVIEAIDEFFDQKKPDDLLVLYFSGHGIRDEIGSLYLAFKNTIRSRLRSTAVKSDYIKEAMDQSRSKRQVLVLDCCNSGAFPQGTKAELGGSMGMTKAFQGYGRFVLTASDATQFAWEGDQVIGETDNSLFTHFLVKGLEGEADSDGDGRITVDELYDYTYDQISRVTPKQTPTKSSSKVEGEIVLRQSTRIENIKPVDLPDDLISEIDDTRPAVREWAVQRLEKILKGKNIGMMRTAIEALEKIAEDENTTRRVAQAATQVLESFRQVEQKADEERKAREEAERLAILKGEEERLAREKAEAERKAKEEAEKLARAQAETKAAEAEAARLKAERKAEEKAAREAAQNAAKEKTEKEAAERDAAHKAERDAVELASRKKAERKAAEKAEREAEELVARKKAERKAKEDVVLKESKPYKTPWLKPATLGMVVIALILCGFASLNYLFRIFLSPVVTATEPPVTEAPATEAPEVIAPIICSPNGTEFITFPSGGKSVTGALDFEPDVIVPYFDSSFFSLWITQLTLVGLAEWDDQGNLVPELAAEIPNTENGGISSDGLTITWNLQNCLYWSDGKPLTSADVVFTWEAIMDPANAPVSRTGYDKISSIETPDDLTVVINFAELYPPWQTLFTQGPYNSGAILPKHILDGQTALESNDFIRKPTVGSGPFVITEWVAGDSMTLLPNPNFHKGPPVLDQIKIEFVPDSASALDYLQAGTADWYPNFSEADITTIAALEPNIHLITVPGANFEHYFFNLGRAQGFDGRGEADNEGFCPFKDIRVREAITLGINRQEIINNIYFNGLTIIPSSPWFSSYWANTNLQTESHNPSAARALLDGAGYTDSDGDGIREGICDGVYTELSFNFETTTAPLRIDVASAVQSDLAQIGVNFIPIHTPAGTFFGQYVDGGPLTTGNYDMAAYTAGFYPDPYTDNFSCETIPNANQPDGTNWYHNCDPFLSDLMETMNETADPEARKEILDDVQQYLFDNYYIIMMYARAGVYGYTDRFVPGSFGAFSGMNWNAEVWDVK